MLLHREALDWRLCTSSEHVYLVRLKFYVYMYVW